MVCQTCKVYRRNGVPDEYRRRGLSWTCSSNCSLTLISAPMPFASLQPAAGSSSNPADVSTATRVLCPFQAVSQVRDLEGRIKSSETSAKFEASATQKTSARKSSSSVAE